MRVLYRTMLVAPLICAGCAESEPAGDAHGWAHLGDLLEPEHWTTARRDAAELDLALDADALAAWTFPGAVPPAREAHADGDLLVVECERGARIQAPADLTVDASVVSEAFFTIDLGDPRGSRFELAWTTESGERHRLGATDRAAGLLTFRLELEKHPQWRGTVRDLALVPIVARDGATVRLRSIRFTGRFASLADPGWGQGEVFLASQFRQAVFAAAPAACRVPLDVPAGCTLHLGFGAIGGEGVQPVRFVVRAREGDEEEVLADLTLEPGSTWVDRALPLAAFAGERIELVLAAESGDERVTACWSEPILRWGERTRPDVFVYLADTLRADHLAVYGYPRATSPSLSELASTSVVFERCVAQGNWTKSSVPSFMTSTHVATHGVPRFRRRIPPDLATLAESLRAEGYRTASFLMNRIAGHDSGLERGFSVLFDEARLPQGQRDPARSLPAGVLPWIRAHAGEPLFVYVHTAEPHTPYDPPDDLRLASDYAGPVDGDNFPRLARTEEEVRHVISLYDGEIAHMDRALGSFVESLRELGLFEDSCFVFTSDHGEAFREHGAFKHGAGLYFHQVDVPLVVRRPGGKDGGSRRADLVRSIDVMPTLLRTAGAEVPPSVEGVDLFERGGDAARGVHGMSRTGAVTESSPLSTESGRLEWAFVDSEWKVILGSEESGAEQVEVFDLRADPRETAPLEEPYPPVARRILDELRAWREASAEPAGERAGGEDAMRDLGALEELEALGYVGDEDEE